MQQNDDTSDVTANRKRRRKGINIELPPHLIFDEKRLARFNIRDLFKFYKEAFPSRSKTLVKYHPSEQQEVILPENKIHFHLRAVLSLFYDAIQNNQLRTARGILYEFTKNNQYGWQGRKLIAEMCVALYRKTGQFYGSGLGPLYSVFSGYFDMSNYIHVLCEIGKSDMAAVLARYSSNVRHYKCKSNNFDKLEAIALSCARLEECIMDSHVEVQSSDIIILYEMIKPIDFLSTYYRARCLLLLGEIDRAEKAYTDFCNDHPLLPQGYMQLIRFLKHKNQILSVIRPNLLYQQQVPSMTIEQACSTLLDIDPTNITALEQVKQDGQSIQYFKRLWNAIEVTNAQYYWDELIQVVDENLRDDQFLQEASEYVSTFLSFMPIHIQIQQMIEESDGSKQEDEISTLTQKLSLLNILVDME
jgi:tetratricopeptide (TPR) repeat protein